MSFSISPQVNIFETDATSLAVPFSGDTVGAMAGTAQWGAVMKPIFINKGIDEYLEKMFPPKSPSSETFYIAKDYLQYSNKLAFVRVVGKKARNACYKKASDNVAHHRISISSAPVLHIVDTTTEPNATVELIVNGVVQDVNVTNQNAVTAFQVEVPKGKRIVWMRLTKQD